MSSKKHAPILLRPAVALCETCRGSGLARGAHRGDRCRLCNGTGEMSLAFDRAAREGRLWLKWCERCHRHAQCLNVGTLDDPEWLCARCEMREHPEAREEREPATAEEVPF